MVKIGPPNSFGQIILGLANLDDVQFASLSKLTTAKGFVLKSTDLEKLKSECQTSSVDLDFLLPALAFLSERLNEIPRSPTEVDAFIADLAREVTKEPHEAEQLDDAKLQYRLRIILQKSPQREQYTKYRRLASGFLPNALGFSSFVDIRPNFTDDDDPEIAGIVPLIQFRIRTDSSTPGLRSFVFQMDGDSLLQLRKAMDRAEKKLIAVKEVRSLGAILPEKV